MTKPKLDGSPLSPILTELQRRQRLCEAVRLGARGALIGGVAALLTAVVILAAESGSYSSRMWLSMLAVPAGALLGALAGMLRGVDALFVARTLDRAAAGEDRFASALQLAEHHRRERAQLVLEDAMTHVQRTGAAEAIPLRVPRELKWVPVPVAALIALLLLAPMPQRVIADVPVPEISDEEWKSINDELRRELDALPKPADDKERELVKEFERLAKLLEAKPDKKQALAEIAKLKAELEKRRKANSTRDVSMKKAAKSIRSSKALSKFASKLKEGEYKKAAQELKELAERLKENKEAMSAEDFEAAAADFEQMAQDLASHEELEQASRECSNAASSMNRDKLSDAMKKLSECLKKNADNLKECDGLCRSQSLLDKLLQKFGQCKGGQQCSKCGNGNCGGNCNSFVKNSNKKGGLRAGWGAASKIDGGKLEARAENRLPVLAETTERDGAVSALKTVTPEERARSAQEMRETFANMVRKAEADLSLETVPPAYRDYLRRYFVSIRPNDESTEKAAE